jgi:hypothetical protein
MLTVYWRRRGVGLLGSMIVLLIALAGCGGDSDDNRIPPTITSTPPPTIIAISTWTPEPSPTPRATITLAPTSTSAIVEPTFAPLAETGVSQIGDEVVVTVLEADLNAAIVRTADAASVPVTAPLEVTVEAGYQLQIVMTFYNEFLDEESHVTTRAILEIVEGRIRLEELQEDRSVSGALASDRDIWAVLDAVEGGINGAIFDLLGAEPSAGDLTLHNLRLFPDSPQVRARLEAVFTG